MESGNLQAPAPANPLAVRFIKLAVVYLGIGVTMGVVMGATHNFALHPVHAHVNLLGWASLALAGVIYQLFPAAAATRLAQAHFWLHNLGLPPLMIGLALLLTGHEAFDPVVGIASVVVAVGLLAFIANVLTTLRAGLPARVAVGRPAVGAVAP